MKSEGKNPSSHHPKHFGGSRQNATPYNISEGVAEYAFRQKSAKNFRRPAAPANARRHPARRRPTAPAALKRPACGRLVPRRPRGGPPSTHKAYRPGLGGLPPRPAATAPARRRRRRRGAAPPGPPAGTNPNPNLTLTLTLNGKHSVTIAL